MKPILELAGLRVERSRTTILRGVDWRVTPDEHWGMRWLRSIGVAGIAGRRGTVLTSANLSATFAACLRLYRTGTRYRLEFPRP